MKDSELLLLENQVCFPTYAVANKIVRRYRPLLKELDLTYTQYITMMVLWEKEEWTEAKQVNARLIELGETPVVAIEEYPVITDIKEMLEYDCKDSEEAFPMMSKSLSLFDDDFVTKNMIQQFIVDEQDHYNWVRQHLSLMNEIGYENYLIEQLGDTLAE